MKQDTAAQRNQTGFRMDREKDGIRNFELATCSGNGRESANSGLSRDAGRQVETFGWRVKQACFLDRDGVINVEKYYLHEPELLELIKGSGEALALLQQAGFLLVVVTNQAGVAKGKFPAEDVEKVHLHLAELLAPFGVKLDKICCCMHHPEFTGPCSCRKPAPGMLLQAAEDLHIDLGRSYMIGDRMSDLAAGVNAGVRQSILVRTGYGAETEKSGLAAAFPVYDDLLAAVKEGILKQE